MALGVLQQLSRRVGRVAVFRPIVRPDTATYGGRDYVLELLISHDAVEQSYEDGVGVTYDEVHKDPGRRAGHASSSGTATSPSGATRS